MNDNYDLLDLCTLNLLEERTENSDAIDCTVTLLEVIKRAKREVVKKILNNNMENGEDDET